jgi:hypothetical protein
MRNREIVEERGLNENEMAKMERLYLQLAGRASTPSPDAAIS